MVALIVCTAVIAFSALFSSIYTERIEALANDLSYEFNSLSNASVSTFKDKAVELASSFGYKNKLEVQVIDRNDNVIVTTTGFQPSDIKMPDYEQAKKNGEIGVCKTETEDGEPILACTTVIYDGAGRCLGAYRWITSSVPRTK